MKSTLTIVTALFDLKRGDLNPGFQRSFDHYLECFSRLLKVDYRMVIYCDSDVEEFVWKHRSPENTRIVHRTLDDLRQFPFYDQVQKIRTNPDWYNYAGWLPDSPQAKLELYNPLVLSKQFMLNDASLFNFWGDGKHYLWVDAGISNTIGDPTNYFDKDFEARILPDMNKMLYLAFPYDGKHEVHGFEKNAMNSIAGKETEYVCRGGIFGGPKHIINDINDIYYGLMSDTITQGLMGTEETLFTILSYKYPEKVNIRMIEDNGLVYKYLEDLKKKPIKNVSEELALYVLTFNLPQQFELWCESFIEAYPNDFERVKKYVIDNSTDKKVAKKYKELFNKHGFEVMKRDNIGINGGRQLAADHFLESDHEYMIFFEDDMLMHKQGAGLSKNGFGTYYPNLFDGVLDIMKQENLDFLKLSHDEFYGNNHNNWAYKNLPQNKKDEYFPERSDGVENWKTKIDYTGSLRGIPYAVGEYHYCNWPLVFSRKGTEVVFKETQYAHLYEQTWMSQTMMYMRADKIKAGCLLASPINHWRKYHYKAGTRRENEHYTN